MSTIVLNVVNPILQWGSSKFNGTKGVSSFTKFTPLWTVHRSTMSKHEFIIAFDCGGIFANDIPVDMFKKLATDKYSVEDQSRIADCHARKYVPPWPPIFSVDYDRREWCLTIEVV